LIGCGLFQQATGHVFPTLQNIPAQEPLGLFLLARAFAAGCTALTGVEAISDGVLAFKPPEWKNARLTLTYMGVILGAMFLGISYLAHIYQVIPNEHETLLSVLGKQIFCVGIFYYYLQAATLLILLLAANTSYADFPRLCYFLRGTGTCPGSCPCWAIDWFILMALICSASALLF